MVLGGCVYILTNKYHTVYYVGVTSSLHSRTTQHREKFFPKSFSAKYNVCKLVYYEWFDGIEDAIFREKQIKKYSRIKKVALILKFNPQWKDLYDDVRHL